MVQATVEGKERENRLLGVRSTDSDRRHKTSWFRQAWLEKHSRTGTKYGTCGCQPQMSFWWNGKDRKGIMLKDPQKSSS